MRLLVRLGVQIIISLGVSRTDSSAPHAPKSRTLFQSVNPISGQSNSRGRLIVKQQRKRYAGLLSVDPSSFVLPHNIHILAQEC